jgi:hypothetical protein
MMMGIMETDQDKMIDTVDYEGDMARICAKWKHGSKDNNYEFGASEMVKKRNINLEGGGREAYSKEGYEELKLPILKSKGFIEMTIGDKFKLT